jgi:hypothetical protein
MLVQYPNVPNVLRAPWPVTSRKEISSITGAEMVATSRSANAAKRRNDPQWMIPGMAVGGRTGRVRLVVCVQVAKGPVCACERATTVVRAPTTKW